MDVARGGTADRPAEKDSPGNFERNPFAPEVPYGCGLGLSVLEPFVGVIIGRREPAYPFGHADWFSTGQCLVYFGRTQYRSAPTGQPSVDKLPEGFA